MTGFDLARTQGASSIPKAAELLRACDLQGKSEGIDIGPVLFAILAASREE